MENHGFSIPEMVMLLCFAVAWFPNIHKAWVSRTAKGVSLPFMIVVLVGYLAGITHKLLYGLDIVLAAYLLDTLLVLIGISLYFRNHHLDTLAARAETPSEGSGKAR